MRDATEKALAGLQSGNELVAKAVLEGGLLALLVREAGDLDVSDLVLARASARISRSSGERRKHSPPNHRSPV